MDSSTAQEMGSQRLENCMLVQQQEKKARGADMQPQKCPRCDSTNTKFCYYNNYSLSQPRYFCKSCRRYWTKGGTLRNVPVGGGCRKNKRSSSSSSSSSRRTQEQPFPSPIPSFAYESNDLSLAIATLQKQSSDDQNFSIWGNPNMPQQHPGGILGNFGTNYGMFQETPPQNLYYGNGNLEMGMGMSGNGMGIPFEDFGAPTSTTASTAVTTVKQEMCGGREGESRVLWGFPWQNGHGSGDGGGAFPAAPEFDSGRVNWSGIGSTNWQGLLNSPLM